VEVAELQENLIGYSLNAAARVCCVTCYASMTRRNDSVKLEQGSKQCRVCLDFGR
jgi:hypothetical protein